MGAIKKALDRKFFERDTVTVARELLGKFLVRRRGKKEIAGMIIETEAYDGPHDRGSHASRGRTERNKVMFGPAGRWYPYFTYGMHWMINVVTREEGYPAAVLIRGVAIETAHGRGCSPAGGADRRGRRQKEIAVIGGSATLTKYFKIDRKFYGKPVAKKTGLWIEGGGARMRKKSPYARCPERRQIASGPRVGIEYAGPYWKRRKWRFYMRNIEL